MYSLIAGRRTIPEEIEETPNAFKKDPIALILQKTAK